MTEPLADVRRRIADTVVELDWIHDVGADVEADLTRTERIVLEALRRYVRAQAGSG